MKSYAYVALSLLVGMQAAAWTVPFDAEHLRTFHFLGMALSAIAGCCIASHKEDKHHK